MGESDRYIDYRQPRRKFSLGEDGNALMALISLNIVFFIVLFCIRVFYDFDHTEQARYYSEIVEWFALPGAIKTFLHRPWTLLTYVFSEVGTEWLRLVGNMIWLYAFGNLLQMLTGNSKLFAIFIYGGILGGIFFLLINNLSPALQPFSGGSWLLGANTGTLAIAAAATTLAPDTRFFQQIRGGLPIWVLLAVYIVIDLLGVTTMGVAVAVGHLGGALAGFLFVLLLRNGTDTSLWMNRLYFKLINLFTPDPAKNDIKGKVFYNTGNRSSFTRKPIINQQRVDEILDKINQHGYGSLSKDEKDILKKAAEDDAL